MRIRGKAGLSGERGWQGKGRWRCPHFLWKGEAVFWRFSKGGCGCGRGRRGGIRRGCIRHWYGGHCGDGDDAVKRKRGRRKGVVKTRDVEVDGNVTRQRGLSYIRGFKNNK